MNEEEARAILAAALPAWAPWAPLVAAACLVSLLVVANAIAVVIAMAPRMGLTEDAHWTARARRTYPARSVAASLALLGPVVIAVFVPFATGPLAIMPGRMVGLVTFFLGLFASMPFIALTTRGTGSRPVGILELMRGQLVYFVAMLPHAIVLGVVAVAMPDDFSFVALLLALVAIAPLEMLRRGMWLELAARLGLARPANERLARIVHEQADAIGVRPRAIWILRWPVANALAFVHSGDLAFTERILALEDAELAAVTAHELGHLTEGDASHGRRFLSIASLYPLVLVRPLWAVIGPGALVVLLVPRLVVGLINRKVARRGEEHADHVAHHHTDGSVYARALERIYELNAVPAVIGPGRRAHPDLYDRMVVAGLAPGFSRPLPPSRAIVRVALVVWLCVIVAGAIALRVTSEGSERGSGDRLAFAGGSNGVHELDVLARDAEENGDLRVAAAALVVAASAGGHGTAERLLEAAAALADDEDCAGAAVLVLRGRAAARADPDDPVRPVVEDYIAGSLERCE